jgi:4-hydroxy-tetrahydrodipicolinate synthase
MDYTRSEAKRAARERFRGVWGAITTPFTADNRIDEPGLRHNMRWLIEHLAIDGVFCTGTMGEFWALTKEERKRVVEIVVEEARGRCLTIPHTGHHSADETVDLTNHAEAVGADFSIVMNPYYPPPDEEGLYHWFEHVSARTRIGIWMFDTPYSEVALSPELTARVATLENICGLKCSRSLDHYARVRELVGDSIVMSHPSETEMLRLMREQGMRVHMSSAAPFLLQVPGSTPVRDYAALALAGDYAAAQAIRDHIEPLRAVHEKWVREPWHRHHLIAIAQIKAWCDLIGMVGGPVRPPLLAMTDVERAEMRADLERVGLLATADAAQRTRAR